jgi:hypothetical protein
MTDSYPYFFHTVEHKLLAYQTVPSSNSLDSYCCMRTRHTIDSYPNFFHTIEHKLLAYILESDLLSWSVHRFKGDK